MTEPGTGEYVRGRPHPALRAHVLGYTGYLERSARPVRRRQAPSGGCTVILGFGGPLRLHGPAGPTVPMAFVAGMHDEAVVTEFSGAQAGVQVDLTPLGAHVLLDRPMSELTNSVPHLGELGVPELARLPERLAADAGWPRRFARVDAALRSLLEASRTRPDAEVAWAWGRLVRAAGAVGVRELAEDTGWSRRHLLGRFRAQVGLAPKATARVLRFRRASGLLVPPGPGGGPDLPPTGPLGDATLADVAATCGYADHSHLVREFRALAGCTPSQFVAEWRQVAQLQAGAG